MAITVPFEHSPERFRKYGLSRPNDEEVGENTWSKISREVNVIGGGLLDGAAEGMERKNIAKSAPELVGSLAIGALLAMAEGKKGWFRLGAEVTSLAFTAGFVKDLSDERRLSALGNAMSDTWKSSGYDDFNRSQVKKYGGAFAFDTAAMMVSGGIGAAYGKTRQSMAASILEGKVAKTEFGHQFDMVESGAYGSHSISDGNQRARFQNIGQADRLPPIDVFPDEPLKPSSHAARLVENADKLPIKEVARGERVKWKLPTGHTVEWKPSLDGIGVRLQAQKFVDHFMNGRFLDALSTSIEAPVMQSAELNARHRATRVSIPEGDLAKPEILALKMDDLSTLAHFKWQKTIRGSEIIGHDNDVIVPIPVIELSGTKAEVPLVDFVKTDDGYKVTMPNKTVDGRQLTEPEASQIAGIRSSVPGQRLLAETALFGFEESIVHANQHLTMAGRIASPSYAEFARDFSKEHGTRNHYLAFLGCLDWRNPHREALFEQEVPAIAYDAGMPLDMVKRHFFFGARHVEVRHPVITFLEAKENHLFD